MIRIKYHCCSNSGQQPQSFIKNLIPSANGNMNMGIYCEQIDSIMWIYGELNIDNTQENLNILTGLTNFGISVLSDQEAIDWLNNISPTDSIIQPKLVWGPAQINESNNLVKDIITVP